MNIIPLFLITSLLNLFIMITIVPCSFGKDLSKDIDNTLHSEKDFDLSLTGKNAITLKANNSSLLSIINEIADQMDFQVIPHLQQDVEITEEFKDVSLEKLLISLRVYADIVFIKDKQEGSVTTVLVFPLDRKEEFSEETKISKSKIQNSGDTKLKTESVKNKGNKPEPVKFEFDPSQYIKK